jgi:hypothetical protein
MSIVNGSEGISGDVNNGSEESQYICPDNRRVRCLVVSTRFIVDRRRLRWTVRSYPKTLESGLPFSTNFLRRFYPSTLHVLQHCECLNLNVVLTRFDSQ